jgi:precorrin-8X/cobalt-precorrin-8 methylmutase
MNNVSLLESMNKKLPAEIEAESFRIIEKETPNEIKTLFSPEEWIIARRIIHTTGDISIVSSLKCSRNAVAQGIKSLKNGYSLFCDSNMIKNGLSVAKLKNMNNSYSRENINCYIADSDVAEYAKENKLTRAASAVEKAGNSLNNSIILIGNAPSALIKIIEKFYNNEINPKLIIGMPVGFVNVIESKKLLVETDLPYVTIEGRRGGSPLAVATLHALIEISKL